MIGLKTKLNFNLFKNSSITKKLNLISNVVKSFSRVNDDYPYLVLQNTPNYWNEVLVKARLSELGELEEVKKINTDINKLYRSQESVYSGENEHLSKKNKDTNTFLIKLKNINNKTAFHALEGIIHDHKDIKFEFCKSVNVNTVNLTQPKAYEALILIYSKDSDKKLSSLGYLNKFLLENGKNIKVKNSYYDNFMYIWFNDVKIKEECKEILDSHPDQVYSCDSKAHYTRLPSSKPSSITYKSTKENDIRLLRDLNNKVEVLKCTKIKNSDSIMKDLNRKIDTLKNVLREKENLPYIKPYSVVGSSGIILYNL